MADNTVLPGTGTTVASDDVAGVHFQKVKIDVGGDGASVILSSSNPLPVILTAGAAELGSLIANQSVNVAQMNAVTVLMGNGASGTGAQRVTLANDSTGIIASIGTSVVPGTSATHLGKAEDAAHTTGDTGVFVLAVRTDTPATTAGATGDYDALHTGGEGALQVSNIASAKTGMTRARIASAASTNATSVKGSAGVLWGFELTNNTAVVKYFKLYNKASAPTVGTDTPVETIIIQASSGAVAHMRQDEFATGIAYAITSGVADSNTGAVGADDIHGALFYK